MAIRFLDMFAGIGGFRSGLERIDGFQCVGHCEIDKRTNQAYCAMYETEGEYYYADARQIIPESMPKADLICAGFPCQSFSVAGKRMGFNDTRGTLFFEIARIARAKRPSFLLLENVTGLLSHDSGKTFETILTTLVEMGYSCEWCVLNSKYYGIPQQRRRLYIIGYLDTRCAGKIFPLENRNGKNLKQLIPGPQGQRVYKSDGVACTQCAGSGGWGGKTGLYFIDLNANPNITDVVRCITARQNSGISNHRGEHSGVLIEEAALNSRHINREIRLITVKDQNGIIHCGRIRKLMPLECWRLQGFTDEQFYKVQATGLKDSHLYKMAGNAVSVPVISAIGEKIKRLAERYQITEGGT